MTFYLISILLFSNQVSAFDGWNTLNKLEMRPAYDEFLGEEIELPTFSDELLAYDGQIISLEGYVIPLETSGSADYFVLSRFPFNSCFFCGNAGPETVAEVYTDELISLRDEKVNVTGRLELNSDDPLHLFFILNKATVVRMD